MINYIIILYAVFIYIKLSGTRLIHLGLTRHVTIKKIKQPHVAWIKKLQLIDFILIFKGDF